MRVRAALAVVATVLAVLPAAGQASSPDRHQAVRYSLGTVEKVRVGTAEDRITVSADDEASAVVRVTLDITSPAGRTSQVSGCNRVSSAVTPGSTVSISTGSGFCGAGQLALATAGTLHVLFHHRRQAVRRTASAMNRWALVIGIQDYAGRTESTVGGVGDAAAVRSALLHSGWRDDHILVLTERDASAEGIRAGIAWLVGHSTPDTFTLLHYSGHICIASRGPCGSGHTWLWSQDNRFLSEDEVAARLSGLQGYTWLDVAGCEAGAFDVGFHSDRHLFTASSRAWETSYEDPSSKESVWVHLTWSQGYRQGQADKDGRGYHATMRQMAAYGAAHAPGFTANGEAGPQHPVWLGGDPSWRLWAPPGR
ncbi:MAG: caspase family protein [Mycobacteriales bacterium]